MKGCANCELTSPSHAIEVERTGDDAVVTYRAAAATTIGDSLVAARARPRGASRRSPRTSDGDDRYLLVRAPAELAADAPRAYRPRTWVILDDVSASRGPMELRAQADLVDAFLRELDEEDRVAVVAFDVEARQKLAPTRVLDVDRQAVRARAPGRGRRRRDRLRRPRSTRRPTLLAGVAPDDAMIVYLGDGVITSGARNLDALRAQLAGKAHFVGVGVGDGPDTQTLEALAAATGGYATTIDLADDVGWRAFDLVAALHTPRVTGLEARLVDASGALVPATAYLAVAAARRRRGARAGRQARGRGHAGRGRADRHARRRAVARSAIALGGRAAAGRLPAAAVGAAPHRGAPAREARAGRRAAVHGRRRRDARRAAPARACPTEAELREKRDEAIRQEVVALGKQYFLLSRHTSLLVLENDAMYAQYGVTKGAGDTWAPYAMPAKIPVVPRRPRSCRDVADDAELVRTPLQVFYDYGGYDGLRCVGSTRTAASSSRATSAADRPRRDAAHARAGSGSAAAPVALRDAGHRWAPRPGGGRSIGPPAPTRRSRPSEARARARRDRRRRRGGASRSRPRRREGSSRRGRDHRRARRREQQRAASVAGGERSSGPARAFGRRRPARQMGTKGYASRGADRPAAVHRRRTTARSTTSPRSSRRCSPTLSTRGARELEAGARGKAPYPIDDAAKALLERARARALPVGRLPLGRARARGRRRAPPRLAPHDRRGPRRDRVVRRHDVDAPLRRARPRRRRARSATTTSRSRSRTCRCGSPSRRTTRAGSTSRATGPRQVDARRRAEAGARRRSRSCSTFDDAGPPRRDPRRAPAPSWSRSRGAARPDGGARPGRGRSRSGSPARRSPTPSAWAHGGGAPGVVVELPAHAAGVLARRSSTARRRQRRSGATSSASGWRRSRRSSDRGGSARRVRGAAHARRRRARRPRARRAAASRPRTTDEQFAAALAPHRAASGDARALPRSPGARTPQVAGRRRLKPADGAPGSSARCGRSARSPRCPRRAPGPRPPIGSPRWAARAFDLRLIGAAASSR